MFCNMNHIESLGNKNVIEVKLEGFPLYGTMGRGGDIR